MSLAHVVAYFSWPLFALGIAAFVALRRRREWGYPPSTVLAVFAIVAVAVPIFAILAYGEATPENMFVADVTYIPGGFALLLFAPFLWKRASTLAVYTSSSPGQKRIAAIACVAFGIVAIFIGTFNTLGDFMRERVEVSGVVTGKHISRGFRHTAKYYVDIDGRRFATTADIFDQIDPKSRVRVMVGHASGTIFEVTDG